MRVSPAAYPPHRVLCTYTVVDRGRHPKKSAMTTHNVTFVVNQRITDKDIDIIFEHADDATPERGNHRTLVHFAREAPSWPAAVVSALADLEAAGFQAASVRTDDPH